MIPLLICSKCKDQGLKSTIIITSCTSTCVAYIPFYDEGGKIHHHDSNATNNKLKCSNGHEWVDTYYSTCWCGWTSNSDSNSE